jgi:hypothetical protein
MPLFAATTSTPTSTKVLPANSSTCSIPQRKEFTNEQEYAEGSSTELFGGRGLGDHGTTKDDCFQNKWIPSQ